MYFNLVRIAAPMEREGGFFASGFRDWALQLGIKYWRIKQYLDVLWWNTHSEDRITNVLQSFLRKWNFFMCSSTSAGFWVQFDSPWSKWAGQFLLLTSNFPFSIFHFSLSACPPLPFGTEETGLSEVCRGLLNPHPMLLFFYMAFIHIDLKLPSLASGHLIIQHWGCLNCIFWEVGVVCLEWSCFLCYIVHLQLVLASKH